MVDVSVPQTVSGTLLIAARASLISAGTERTKIVTGEKNLLQKARARPDLVKKMVDRARVEGVRSAVAVARDRLAALTPIGYSAAGVVLQVGAGVTGLAPGDRVACGGEGANHAEILCVERNLVARIPAGVAFEDAAYATVGAIALHGVRQADVGLGDVVGVIGLGLVGQLATRLLVAAGCTVLGIDLDPRGVELASRAGAHGLQRHDPMLEPRVASLTRGIGLDAVLLCASSASPDPLHLAARLLRDRGRVVVVGETRIDVDRAPLYEKELELRMSRSYGPGRYDRDYEEHGRDLPPGYVRWTEQRNMQAFLDLVATGRVVPTELTTHRFPIEQAAEAYRLIAHPAEEERPFGVVLTYPETPTTVAPRSPAIRRPVSAAPGIALVGAGAFARATLIPALAATSARRVAVASSRGLTAADVARRFAFERAAASFDEILADETIDGVVIATRHPSHAALAAAALRAGKAVLVEKPLALTHEQLDEVEAALTDDSLLMVGFNRRYAPLTERLRTAIAGCDDLTLAARVNAGLLPADHWLHDPEDGGGRFIGEGCHFVDLLCHLAGTPAIEAGAVAVPQPGRPIACSDSVSAVMRFPNGVASLVYSGGGDSSLPKERIEIHGGGLSAVLDDFRLLTLHRGNRATRVKKAQDKGHRAQVAAFVAALNGTGERPDASTYLASSRLTLDLVEALRTR